MALLDILTSYNSDVFLDTDPGWRQFITDHKLYLLANSPTRVPSDQLMGQVAQDLTWYLRKIGVTRPIAWIVGYINDIDADLQFDQSRPIRVPELSLIATLYQSYATTKQVRT